MRMEVPTAYECQHAAGKQPALLLPQILPLLQGEATATSAAHQQRHLQRAIGRDENQDQMSSGDLRFSDNMQRA